MPSKSVNQSPARKYYDDHKVISKPSSQGLDMIAYLADSIAFFFFIDANVEGFNGNGGVSLDASGMSDSQSAAVSPPSVVPPCRACPPLPHHQWEREHAPKGIFKVLSPFLPLRCRQEEPTCLPYLLACCVTLQQAGKFGFIGHCRSGRCEVNCYGNLLGMAGFTGQVWM